VVFSPRIAPLDPRATKLPLPDDLEGELTALRRVTRDRPQRWGAAQTSRATPLIQYSSCASAKFTEKFGNSASVMDYSRFNYVAQPETTAYLLPIIGVYDYFAIDWATEYPRRQALR